MRIRAILAAILFSAAPAGAAPPRVEAAKQAAAREKLEAQARERAAKTKDDKAAAAWRLGRAEAWDKALSKAASSATPHDADLIIVDSGRGAKHERDGRSGSLPPGLFLREGDRVMAGRSAPAEIRFHDGTSLILSPDAVLSLLQVPRSDPAQAMVILEAGRLHYEAPSLARGTLKVRAGRSEFLLEEGASDVGLQAGAASVTPYRGKVEASGQGGRPAAPWWEK